MFNCTCTGVVKLGSKQSLLAATDSWGWENWAKVVTAFLSPEGYIGCFSIRYALSLNGGLGLNRATVG